MSAFGNSSTEFFLCFNQSLVLVQVVASVNIALACVVIITSVMAIVILFCLNKHQIHMQRLVLYITFAALLEGLSSIGSGFSVLLPVTYEQISRHICQANGFITNTFLWTELILIWWIAIDLLLVIVFSLFTNRKMEAIQLLSSFVVPPLLLWIPLLFDSYGFNDGICDIRMLDYNYCINDSTGYVVFILVRLLPFTVLLVFVGILYCVMIVVLNRRERLCHGKDPKRSEELVNLRQRVYVLAVYPLTAFLLFLLPSFVQFSAELVPNLQGGRVWLALMTVVLRNCGGVVFSLAFIFDDENRQHFRRYCLMGSCFIKRVRVTTLQNVTVSWTDSLKTPVRDHPPYQHYH